jgi:hypothetical protein
MTKLTWIVNMDMQLNGWLAQRNQRSLLPKVMIQFTEDIRAALDKSGRGAATGPGKPTPRDYA